MAFLIFFIFVIIVAVGSIVLFVQALPVIIICILFVYLLSLLGYKGATHFFALDDQKKLIFISVLPVAILITAMAASYFGSPKYKEQKQKVYICEASETFEWDASEYRGDNNYKKFLSENGKVDKGSIVYLVPNSRTPVNSEVYIAHIGKGLIYFKAVYDIKGVTCGPFYSNDIFSAYPWKRTQVISLEDFLIIQRRHDWPSLSYDEVVQLVEQLKKSS